MEVLGVCCYILLLAAAFAILGCLANVQRGTTPIRQVVLEPNPNAFASAGMRRVAVHIPREPLLKRVIEIPYEDETSEVRKENQDVNWFKRGRNASAKQSTEQRPAPTLLAAFDVPDKPLAASAHDHHGSIYCLQHIETKEFVCLVVDGIDHLACFSAGDDACEFRSSMKLDEYVDVHATTLAKSPFRHFWLDKQVVRL